ncbi:MAG: hypothetical protein LBP35_06660 [Candidatus Ancillula trichonymphae]|nr:hypothetical protein [Candidatus Ancillula trichonymphae]
MVFFVEDLRMNNFLQNSANQNTKQTTSTATPSQTPPTPSTSSSSSNSERNNGKNSDNSANLKLSDAVKTELLQHYQVNDFSSIKNVSPKDMAGHISNILDSGSNQVVVILDLKYSDTSRSEVKNCVASLLKVLKDKLHNLGGIVVATSDNYYTERAKK